MTFVVGDFSMVNHRERSDVIVKFTSALLREMFPFWFECAWSHPDIFREDKIYWIRCNPLDVKGYQNFNLKEIVYGAWINIVQLIIEYTSTSIAHKASKNNNTEHTNT